jgi:hypothetical protein
MSQRLQHRRHLPADASNTVAVDQPRNSAHLFVLLGLATLSSGE